jgi:hypothetical protein
MAPFLGLPSSHPRTFVAGAAIADGARVSNRLDFLTFRRERFTLDQRGYRNPPQFKIDHPRVMLVGSSFSLGLALNDEDIFNVRLNRELGPVVYNASSTFEPVVNASDLIEKARSAGMHGGWILYEALNRAPVEYRSSSGHSFAEVARQRIESRPYLTPARGLLRSMGQPAALMRLATLLNMRLENDRFLPNPFKNGYVEEELLTGRHVLVFAGDKRFAQRPERLPATVDALVSLSGALERQGYHLAVLLVPNTYSVYFTLYRDHPADDASAGYMAELARRLAENHVPALNLLPPLREFARSELNAGRMIYYPDDSHWNPSGVARSAELTAPWLANLLRGGPDVAHPAP